MVEQIESNFAFQEGLAAAGDELVVVDVSATGCRPCKMIKTFFHDVASECEVKCMPTLQFFKKGQKVGEFSGANKESLEATINNYSNHVFLLAIGYLKPTPIGEDHEENIATQTWG
ncbi:thioredoxin-like [Eulemur rufifrons]|uniref:thioredoxin-like n=1 Tax=Eulemur rufifrons TaxID=859984 RepID=UPI003742DDFD